MNKFFSSRSDGLLGLDIKKKVVHLIHLHRSRKRYKLVAYASSLMPDGAVEAGAIKNKQETSKAIAQAVKSCKTKCKNAATAIASNLVISKVVQVSDDFTEDEIEEQVFAEADKFVPYAMEDVALDFEVRYGESKNDQQPVLIAACRRENVIEHQEVLEDATLKAKIIDFEQSAMERAFALVATQGDPQKAQALIDVGDDVSCIYVFKNKKNIFSRSFPLGCKLIDDEIRTQCPAANAKIINFSEYQKIPINYQTTILDPFKQQFKEHAKNLLEYFSNSDNAVRIEHAYLAGSGALIPGFSESLQQALKISISLADPFSSMIMCKKIDKKKLKLKAPQLMLACGLAMGEF